MNVKLWKKERTKQKNTYKIENEKKMKFTEWAYRLELSDRKQDECGMQYAREWTNGNKLFDKIYLLRKIYLKVFYKFTSFSLFLA